MIEALKDDRSALVKEKVDLHRVVYQYFEYLFNADEANFKLVIR